MTGHQILVVAPYNAHVSRLADRLDGSGVRVGTVDRFQGKQAPVVIYSMATSRPEDAPRGLEWTLSLGGPRASWIGMTIRSRREPLPRARRSARR